MDARCLAAEHNSPHDRFYGLFIAAICGAELSPLFDCAMAWSLARMKGTLLVDRLYELRRVYCLLVVLRRLTRVFGLDCGDAPTCLIRTVWPTCSGRCVRPRNSPGNRPAVEFQMLRVLCSLCKNNHMNNKIVICSIQSCNKLRFSGKKSADSRGIVLICVFFTMHKLSLIHI